MTQAKVALITGVIGQYGLLRQIIGQPTASQCGLAARLGVSVGKVNYRVRALVDKGWGKANNLRRSDGRRVPASAAWSQRQVARGERFLAHNEYEFECLHREIAALRT